MSVFGVSSGDPVDPGDIIAHDGCGNAVQINPGDLQWEGNMFTGYYARAVLIKERRRDARE